MLELNFWDFYSFLTSETGFSIWPSILWFIPFQFSQYQSMILRTLGKWLCVHLMVWCAFSTVVRVRARACAGSSTEWGNTLGSRSKVRGVHGTADPHTKWPSTWHWIYRILPMPGLEGNTTLGKPTYDQLHRSAWNTGQGPRKMKCLLCRR